MRQPLSSLVSLTLLAVAAFSSGPGLAQTTRSGGAQNAAVQQLQQLAQERTALKAENDRLKKDLDRATGDLKAAQSERDALKKKVGGAESLEAQSRAACTASEATMQQKQQKLDELLARFRETVQTLREAETARSRSEQRLAEQGRAYDACAVANVGLYDVATEALNRYEAHGPGRADPFTRISRNRVENFVDEYRARARELKLPKTAAAAPGGSP